MKAGSYRIRFPECGRREAEAVIVNTAGGVAGGDDFSVSIAAEAGARLSVTTAAAEKVYRAIAAAGADERARCRRRRARPCAGCRRKRSCSTRRGCTAASMSILSDGASLLLAEAVMFGRTAMDESVQQRRTGRSLAHPPRRPAGLCRDAPAAAARSTRCWRGRRPATARSRSRPSSLRPATTAWSRRVRTSLEGCGSEAAISAWNGIAVVRLCAGDAALLRRDLVSVLNAAGGALPRLWTN